MDAEHREGFRSTSNDNLDAGTTRRLTPEAEVPWGQTLPRRRPRATPHQLPPVPEIPSQSLFEHLAVNWDDGESLADTDSTDGSFKKRFEEKPTLYIERKDWKEMGYSVYSTEQAAHFDEIEQKKADFKRRYDNMALDHIDPDEISKDEDSMNTSENYPILTEGSSDAHYPTDDTSSAVGEWNASTGTVVHRGSPIVSSTIGPRASIADASVLSPKVAQNFSLCSENNVLLSSVPERTVSSASYVPPPTAAEQYKNPLPITKCSRSGSTPDMRTNAHFDTVADTDIKATSSPVAVTKYIMPSLCASMSSDVEAPIIWKDTTLQPFPSKSRAWASLSTKSSIRRDSLDRLKERRNLPSTLPEAKPEQQVKTWGDLSSFASSLGSIKLLREKWERVTSDVSHKNHAQHVGSGRSALGENTYIPPSPIKCSITHTHSKTSPHSQGKSNVEATTAFFAKKANVHNSLKTIECVHEKFRPLYNAVIRVNQDFTAMEIEKHAMEEEELEALAMAQALENNIARKHVELKEIDDEVRQAEFELRLYEYQATEQVEEEEETILTDKSSPHPPAGSVREV